MNDAYLQLEPSPVSVLAALAVAGALVLLYWGWLGWRCLADRVHRRRVVRATTRGLSETERRILAVLLGGECLARQLHRAVIRSGEPAGAWAFDRALRELERRKLVRSRTAVLALDGRPDPQASYALTDDGYDLAAGIGLGSEAA